MNELDYPLFSILAFLGFVVSLIPLPWHLHAWNSGTCYYMIWTSLSCLNWFINSIVWRGNMINWAPVWCDISIRIMLGSSVAIPTASLCINRRLYHIARIQAVMVTRAEKRRAILIDTLLCVLWPLMFIALQYVVQGHRFNIYEDVGCYPYIYNTIVALFLTNSWPILIGMVSGIYCALSLRAFYHRRVQFNEFLASNTSLNASRYFRLMALASSEIICTVPIASFFIWLNTAAQSVQPWISWENTHYNFSRVAQYPLILWADDKLFVLALQLTRWVPIFCAFVFFAFFGFAAEARNNYRALFWVVAKFFGFAPRHTVASPCGFSTIPRHAAQFPRSPPLYKTKSGGHSSDASFMAETEKYISFSESPPYASKISDDNADDTSAL